MASLSPTSHPTLQEVGMILLSAFFFPLLTTIAIISSTISPWLSVSKHINHYRRWRSLSSSTFRPRTVLITGLNTPQALAIARTFYRAGHRVIGAAYEPHSLPIPAQFSRSLEILYRLRGSEGHEKYVRDLVDVVKKEKVELWVNSSGGERDLEVGEVLERETNCRVLQFETKLIEMLQDEVAFRKHVGGKFNLNGPETSENETIGVLSPKKSEYGPGKQYITKSDSIMDTASSEKDMIPLTFSQDVRAQIESLSPTPSHPVSLQESIQGVRYSTHTLIINSKPAAFVAYPTSTTRLTPLLASSLLSRAMLEYTTNLTTSLSPSNSMTGHLCLTFVVPSHLALAFESKFGVPSSEVHSLASKIYVVDSSPNPSLGALAFADVSEDLASAYLSTLPDHEPKGVSNGHWEERIVVPSPEMRGYCFVGFEVVSFVLLPVWGWVRRKIGVREVIGGWVEFIGRVLFWREGWWEFWDPWVGWWAYGGYVVGKGLIGLWVGARDSCLGAFVPRHSQNETSRKLGTTWPE